MDFNLDIRGYFKLNKPFDKNRTNLLKHGYVKYFLIDYGKGRSRTSWCLNDKLDTIYWDRNEKYYDFYNDIIQIVDYIKSQNIEISGSIIFYDKKKINGINIGIIQILNNKIELIRGLEKLSYNWNNKSEWTYKKNIRVNILPNVTTIFNNNGIKSIPYICESMMLLHKNEIFNLHEALNILLLYADKNNKNKNHVYTYMYL